jgi:hypothetical protein
MTTVSCARCGHGGAGDSREAADEKDGFFHDDLLSWLDF